MDQLCELNTAATSSQRLFSFAEIVKGRDSSVRLTDDNLLFAVDLAMVVTGKNRNDAGQAIRNLKEETFQSGKFTDRYLSPTGGHPTKLIDFPGGIELIMVLPGKVARELRVKFTDIIRRYLSGDHTLITEIQGNAASDSPIARMARASMGSPCPDEISKKRQLEREDALFEMEMAERKQRLLQSMAETQSKMADAQGKTAAVQKTLREEYTSLCPSQVLDERAKLMFKDNLLNLACLPSTTALVEVGVPVSAQEDTRPITISTFAAEEGKRYDTKALQRVGAIMSNMYQKKYGGKASQHEQFTDGAVRAVRSYTRKDQDMLREAFRVFDAQNSMTKS
jgi:hypothetical protein